ncbi:response regulator transcription factor [Achromobacter sp. GG226]|uniref:helix-turn-helix transcriptional regulator n=1 Tax=Verticiella alkaliphila TaxID=2779529 RepID=UPI001C0BAD28|nr:LuxR C-terminal-related transcriptional regulator [Verticiella sp. GG226]MBU4610193.1 response regulator transcription factor [Verticiella sp. GG226]
MFGLSGDDRNDQLLLDRMIALTAPRHILLLTDELRVPLVRHASVAGRIRRSAPSDLVEAAVKLILAGGRCFPDTPHAEQGVVSVEPAPVAPATLLPGPRLIAQGSRELRITPRQFEILVLRAHGMSLKAVGRALGISEATVKAHASSMYRRLDVTNCQEAIQLATRRGVNLLPGDSVARTGDTN